MGAGIELLHFTQEIHVLSSRVNQEANGKIGINGFLCFNAAVALLSDNESRKTNMIE